MKKLFSTLIIVMLVLTLATSAYAMGVVGGGMNELVLGDNVAEIVFVYDEEWDEYYGMPANFQWVATETGTLTVDFSDNDEFAAYANIYIVDAEGNMTMEGIYEKGGSVSFQVTEGYTVMMEVACMDTITEEGTIFFNFTLSMGEPQEPGTTENDPILVEFQWNEEYSEGTATVTVPAGKTLYFAEAWGMGYGMELSVNGEFYCVMPGRNPMVWAPPVFSLTNDSAEDATYELKLTWPLGTDYNPAELPINDSTVVELPENLQGGYVFKWFATEDGVLTITVEGEFWNYTLSNWGSPDTYSDDIHGDYMCAVDGDSNVVSMEVKAGDEIILMVGSDDGNYGMPATTLTVTTTFETAEGPCAHENLVHMDAVEPGCHYNGNIEYWVCYDCECVWADEALTQVTNILSVVLPATGGEVVHFEAVAPGCHFNGNIEYWYCAECQQFWADEALTQITNSKNVVLPAVGGEVIHVEAKDATCYEEGNIEHWYCETCEQVWADEALTQLTNHKNVIVAAGHDVIHFEAVEPGCHYNGNIEYWYCAECQQFWADEALTQVTNSKNVVLPATGGEVVHFEAVAPGCHYDGNIEYWYCAECQQFWADEALTQVTNSKNVVLPAIGGEVIHVDAKAPTCDENGNIEHWYCEECQKVWADEALTQLTNHKNVILGATGHTYVDGICTVCGANDKDVPVTGDIFGVICAVAVVSGMAVVALPKKKEN